ncbi:polysaccharide biosynthesis tyrosine autokinase [Nocardioides sp.]|uniref:polysaccharide biosynthesis tyrosine autokinase n=1 Tax=Nocardioides sp. TaxID=35761 RepID=UPI00286DF74B|nr:polysaccharide biosynthesis tyrosine autokinase [Nocardioides sp.]
MELRDYWRTVRSRWRVVVVCLVTALLGAALLTWQSTPQYSSSTRLFVSTSESDSSSAYTGNLFASQRVTSYADLVTSRQLAERVSAALTESTDPDELRDQVKATVVPETVILEISASDPDAAMARDIAQAYAEELTQLVEDLETPKGGRNALIKATIVDDAQETTDPVSPQPLRNLALAGILGLLLGLGLAVARELLDTTVTASEDIAAVTAAPILGNIFSDDSARLAPMEVLQKATPWAEAFRVLRTNMQYVEVDEDQKVIVITSSLPEEGKSTVAVNLAVTLSLANERVALIECDLRRPLIAGRLGLDGAVGTTSVLIGKISLEEALQSYGDSGLRVLACGPIPPNPSELLQSHAMQRLLADLRSEFDVVILDAPPLLPVTDAALLATQADGAVVVTRHGTTTRDQLTHAIERLDSVDAKVLGVIMNMAPHRKVGSSYGYGYGYGYGHEEVGSTKRAARDAKVRERAEGKAEKSARR